MKLFKITLSLCLLLSKNVFCITICTAADAFYFQPLLNFIGSLHKVNFCELDTLLVFDLGLNAEQIAFLNKIEKLQVHEVRRVHPDILKKFTVLPNGKTGPGWYAWKPVVIKQALEQFPTVLWLDAGTTLLKSVIPLYRYTQYHGYFLCTIGEDVLDGSNYKHGIEWQTTQYVRQKFNLDSAERKSILKKEAVAAGIIGVSRTAQHLFINELYELAHDLRNFQDDGSAPKGFGCARYEQALLGIIAYVKNLHIFRQEPRQMQPMNLTIDQETYPFFITWHGPFVNEKTCIYSSRWDLSRYDYFTSFIKYKETYVS